MMITILERVMVREIWAKQPSNPTAELYKKVIMSPYDPS